MAPRRRRYSVAFLAAARAVARLTPGGVISLRSSVAWRVAALGALAGALYFLACPPYGVAALAWVALAPLLIAIHRAERWRQALWAGGAMGLVACFGGYAWIADTAHRFWQVPWAFATLLLAVFGTFAELQFTVFAVLAWRLRGRLRLAPAAATATLFTFCEILVPRIFPDKLGHTQVNTAALAHAASLVGAHGLSFLLAWIAASLVALGIAWVARRSPSAAADASSVRARLQFTAAELGLATLATIGFAVYGAQHAARLARTPAEHQLDVAIVQANIGDPEEIAAVLGSVTSAIDSTVATYIRFTNGMRSDPPPDVIVWPETAVPAVPRQRILDRLSQMVEQRQTTLIFGAYDAERTPDSRWLSFNAAFCMNPAGEVVGRYAKHKLLIFGEYVPLSDRFPQLMNILPSPGEFTPGPGPRVFDVKGVPLTPLICYELLFPDVVRSALRAGGSVIVNMTNDYWFGRGLEPEQHLALCRMCAMETDRPIVRATNTGISALIDANGEVQVRTRIWEPAVLRATLAVPPMTWTPYVRWGHWTTAVLAAGAWLLAAASRRLLAWRSRPLR